MGCTQDRDKKKCYSIISNQVSYLMPELVRSVEIAQQCLYDQYSPIQVTPVKEINLIGNIHIYAKMENQQQGGSLAIRGAYHKIYRVFDRARFYNQQEKVRIVTSSMGNNGFACAEAFARLRLIKKFENLFSPIKDGFMVDASMIKQSLDVQGQDTSEIKQRSDITPTDPGDNQHSEFLNVVKRDIDFEADVTVFIPKSFSMAMQEKMEKLQGVQVVRSGEDYIDAEKAARQFSQDQNLSFISPYNDVDVIGGLSTIGFEMEQWMKQKKVKLDYIFVSVVAGAVATGIGIYLKYMRHMDVKIIGVQHIEQCQMYKSIQQQRVYTQVDKFQSICGSAITGFEASTMCFPLCSALVDDWVLVSEDEIKKSLCQLMDNNGIVVDGTAAMAYAGCLKYLDQLNEKDNILIKQEDMKENILVDPTMIINCMVIFGSSNIDLQTLQDLVMNKEKQNID